MILLLTIFLLVHGAIGQNVHLYIKSQLDDLRQAVAAGNLSKPGGGYLPSSSAMFTLTQDTQLSFLALANAYTCVKPSSPYLAEGMSMNFYSLTNMNAPFTEKQIVDTAFTRWIREPFVYGIGDDAIYNSTRIEGFANMIYYQATKYGCNVQTCRGPPISYALACVFDKKPVLNAPLYVVSPNKKGCTTDLDCQVALPFARCNVITHLCSATNDTNFIDLNPTTQATSTTVAETTSATTVESTTEASSTTASATTTTTTPTTSMSTATTTTTTSISTATTTTTTTPTTSMSTATTTTTTTPTTSMLTTTTTTATSPTTSMPTTTTTPTTSILTTTTTTTTSMPTTTTTTPSSVGIITEELRLKIINMHNYRRSRLARGFVPNGRTGRKLPTGTNIFRLTYSIELESAAQEYANTCPSEGSTSLSEMGENLASISSNTKSFHDCIYEAIKSFWSQIKTESINDRVVFTEKLMTRAKGPKKFTQMAWATTQKVGCGAQRCGANTVVVCRYSPRGNIVNESIYRQGPVCSACPYGGCSTDDNQPGLCPAFKLN
ncbi:hypothetical protein GCK32_003765 [Trichostrongylus colubriformis]|uniref:SCP domain-containing protein n=1 Tax=Trichostrongylus colubriformis TaxID=6319 RepID=A0AAN8IJI8_TRICO